ncbi:MAG TPA: protein kinase [Polyangiaceae bacterium]|nr:protein kinase [Polyangiaceae bacterium]
MSGVLREGSLIGSRYRLDRLLGEGGFAVVWAATHAVTRRRVALKLLKESYAADPLVRQRFGREARAASAVRHPNVIAIQDVFEEEGGRPVMVMDLLEGETLGERIRRAGALPLEETAAILLPVVSAVECAHSLGIVHRDLKPDNIFLATDPATADAPVVVKVLDFGIAKLTAREGDAARSGGLTRTGALLGTPFYMSPEQIFGDGEVDARSDVWSLGVILYECLAGVRPTQADSFGQVIRIIASDAIVPLEQRKPELPTEVTGIVGKALSFDNEARPGVAALREVLVAHASPATRLVVTPSVAPTTGFEDTEQAAQQRDVRASTPSAMTRPTGARTRSRRVPAAVVGGAIALSGVAALVWRGSIPSPAGASSAVPAVAPPALADVLSAAPAAAVPQETAPATTSSSAPRAAATGVLPRPMRTAAPAGAHASTPPTATAMPPAATAPTSTAPLDPASYR